MIYRFETFSFAFFHTTDDFRVTFITDPLAILLLFALFFFFQTKHDSSTLYFNPVRFSRSTRPERKR